MLIIAGHFTVEPDKQEAFAAAAKELCAETLKEEGVSFYEFWADLDGSGRYSVLELWESEAHLEAHLETPHVKGFQARGEELGMGNVDIKRYLISEVKPL